jgi:hypothetical protein
MWRLISIIFLFPLTLVLAGCQTTKPTAILDTPTPEVTTNPVTVTLSESEAKTIAEKTCIKGGESLSPGSYNENSQTWWFDANLNNNKPGCNPACVVSATTKTAEINWRCTGLIPPK